jgi:hypothetical protein
MGTHVTISQRGLRKTQVPEVPRARSGEEFAHEIRERARKKKKFTTEGTEDTGVKADPPPVGAPAPLLSKEGWHRFGDGVVVSTWIRKDVTEIRDNHPVCPDKKHRDIHPSFRRRGAYLDLLPS